MALLPQGLRRPPGASWAEGRSEQGISQRRGIDVATWAQNPACFRGGREPTVDTVKGRVWELGCGQAPSQVSPHSGNSTSPADLL